MAHFARFMTKRQAQSCGKFQTYRVVGRVGAARTGLAHTVATEGRVARAAPAKEDDTNAICGD